MELILDKKLDNIFSALGDPVRRKILKMLFANPLSVNEIAAPFNISLPAISKHLKVLEWAGLLTQKKEGNFRKCSVRGEAMKEAADWLKNYRVFWEIELDNLEEYFKEEALKRSKKNKSDENDNS